ncbi:MAG: ATP-binding protein [Bdellovibrionota bacterium]
MLKTPLAWVTGDKTTEKNLPSEAREDIIFCTFDEAIETIRKEGPWGYFIEMDHPRSELFLKELGPIDPDSPRILIYNKLTEKSLKEGINSWKAFDFLEKNFAVDELMKLLSVLREKRSDWLTGRELRKELSVQKRKLEKLTESLEKIVEERTGHIEKSHLEESVKLQKERNLIRFIKDMAFQRSFEEFLQILRREFRKLHKLGDPYLFFRVDEKTSIMSIENGSFVENDLNIALEFPENVELNNKAFSQILANLFGRPFIKTILIPFSQANSILALEHNFNEEELLHFQELISERWPVMNMALDRSQSEKKLNLYSYRWEKTFDGIRDPVAILNIDREVVRSNKKFSDRFVSTKCYETFAQRQTPCENCPLEKSKTSGLPESSQVQIKGRTFRVSSFPVRTKLSEQPTTFVHHYQDVTESRHLYLRMVQSEKMGALGSLAGHLAHELNNPFTGIRSLVELLLKEKNLEENLRKDLEEIGKATLRSQKIIRNLIEFVKEERGEWTMISLDEIVDRTLPMMKTALRRHNLHLDLQAEGVQIFVEPQLLQQVVFNLLNNASQAMKEAGTVGLSTRILADQKTVELTLSDGGDGIPQEIQSRIFEPFFTTKQEGFGTGLGLSLSKSIIEKFKGTLFFESKIGEGTKFFVHLPIAPLVVENS